MSAPGRGEISKHILVREYVESRIRSGALKAGDRLPTESELMHLLDISRTPIRQALIELARDGWIYRIRGSGSYVKRAVGSSSIDIYAILYSNQRGIEKDIIHGMRRAVAQHPSGNIHLVLKTPGRDTSELIDVIHQLPKPASGGLVVIPIVDTSRALNRLLGASLRKLADDKFHVVQLDRCVPPASAVGGGGAQPSLQELEEAKLAAIDCTGNPETCQKYGRSWPRLDSMLFCNDTALPSDERT